MPLLIALLLVCGLAIFLLSRPKSPASTMASSVTKTSAAAADDAARLDIAFVSDGKLFYRKAGSPVVEEHLSNHAQTVLERRERSKHVHGWKQDTSFGISGRGHQRDFSGSETPLSITSAVFDEAQDHLIYFLRDEGVGTLLACEPGSTAEQRLLSKQGLDLEGLSLSPDGQTLAASAPMHDGTYCIALVDRDGNNLRIVTTGDTRDTAPAWIPSAAQRLLFQSVGFGRNEAGCVVAMGNATVQMLNMESGTVTPVLEDNRYDFIQPRICPRGNLYFIRRPYERPSFDANNALLDAVLFPFRLSRAVFHYLNFFSIMYSRKPLTSASGPAVRADMKEIVLQGKRVDAEKMLRQGHHIHGVPSLVPADWQLVSRTPDGAESVVASHVASFDIDARGRIIYSNGRGVFVLRDDGTSALVVKGELVTNVLVAQLPAETGN